MSVLSSFEKLATAIEKLEQSQSQAKERFLYLLHVEGDVEPHIIGPFKDVSQRDIYARKIRKTLGDQDGIYKLDVFGEFRPTVEAYSGAFFDGGEE